MMTAHNSRTTPEPSVTISYHRPVMARLLFIILTGSTLLAGCNLMQLRSGPQLPPFPGHAVAEFDQQHCAEPSGIVYSAKRGTLFVVGDEGDICELQTDGRLVNKVRIRRVDLEGITINPATGMLYALDELAEAILEIHPDNLEVLRYFPIEVTPAHHNPARNNRGFEAITFVPDPHDALDGQFFLANQGSSVEQAAIFNTTAPLSTFATGRPAQITLSFNPGIADLSGLHHDSVSGWLLVISDEHDTLLITTIDGAVQASYTLPGENQEGITLDASGHLYLAEDSGSIIKYTFPATPKH